MNQIRYRVRVHDWHAHLFAITLQITRPQVEQVVSLPVWIPGSYLVREFSRHLLNLQASQDAACVTVTQLDKCTWRIHSKAGRSLLLEYQVYAFDASVRTAWLDSQRGFFNGTSLFLRVHGQEEKPHRIHLSDSGLPKNWQAATALQAVKNKPRGFGDYHAHHYDELVDNPFELGSFWSQTFTVANIPHRLVVSGAPPGFDGDRLLADIQAICNTAIIFWHGKDAAGQAAAHSHYLFLLSAVHDGYGGLEHRNSTALICKRADLPQLGQSQGDTTPDGYVTLLGLVSHEYFHTWNVKRLRPNELTRYDYTQENYTQLLWFFEGFTSYYDDLLLCRAGLISPTRYLSLLGKTINQVLSTPGRKVQSLAQASFDAWIKYYRQDENSLNATVSYYTKGALLALCLDLSLRTSVQVSLDDVMRALWQRCSGGPMREADLLSIVSHFSSPDMAEQLTHWVHGTEDLPLQNCLAQHGVSYEECSASRLDQLGLKVKEHHGLWIKSVLRNSPAEQAGFAAGDEWLGIQIGEGKTLQRWRLSRLEDLPLYMGLACTCQVLVARDQRLLTLNLQIPADVHTVNLSIAHLGQLNAWLMNAAPSS